MRLSGIAIVALCAFACEQADHIEIDPKQPMLKRRGEALQLHGKVMNRRGVQIAGEFPTWKSSQPFVATVDEHGSVMAVASGHALLNATYGSVTAEVPVDVVLVEAVRATPTSFHLKPDGDPVKPAVSAIGLNGRVLADRQVALKSDNSDVVHIDSEGKLWPAAKGETKVRATCEDHEVVLDVVVE